MATRWADDDEYEDEWCEDEDECFNSDDLRQIEHIMWGVIGGDLSNSTSRNLIAIERYIERLKTMLEDCGLNPYYDYNGEDLRQIRQFVNDLRPTYFIRSRE